MNLCEFKKGLFVLRTCDKNAKAQCANCQKKVCGEHANKQANGEILCLSCYTKTRRTTDYDFIDDQRERTYRDWEERGEANSTWYYDIRGDFYEDEAYQPFEARDYDAFDKRSENDAMEDGDLPSFFDS